MKPWKRSSACSADADFLGRWPYSHKVAESGGYSSQDSDLNTVALQARNSPQYLDVGVRCGRMAVYGRRHSPLTTPGSYWLL